MKIDIVAVDIELVDCSSHTRSLHCMSSIASAI